MDGSFFPEDDLRSAMRMGCADCDCVVDDGERVETCAEPEGCCCADVPVA